MKRVVSSSKPIATRVRSSDKRPGPDKNRTPRPEPVELVSEVWQAMVSAVQRRREQMVAEAAKFHLTLPQAHLLRLLACGPAGTMASLADALSCDASNITGLVDRLETRGFIHRGTAEHDRRIKTIVITPEGATVVRQLTRKAFSPPAALRRLSKQQLTTFRAMIERSFGLPPASKSS